MLPFRSFSRDERGTIAVLFAIALVPIIGFSGAAIDYGRAVKAQGKMQAAADSAALAALTVNATTAAQREANARSVFNQNQPDGVTAAVTAKIDKKSAVVTATGDVEMSLLKVLHVPKVPVSAHARAVRVNDGPPACVLALSTTAAPALKISGNASFEAKGCALYSNSPASPSMTIVGSSTVKAGGYCAVGTVTSARTLTPDPMEGCDAAADPFAKVEPPSPLPPCAKDPDKNATSLDPGHYCNGLDLRGKLTLKSGVYYVSGGPLKSNAQSEIYGSGVTFFLIGSRAEFDLNGGSRLELSAQESGPYSGLLIIQERNSNKSGESKLNGNASTKLKGAIYLPTQKLTLNGNGSFGQDGGAMPIVADTIEMLGSTTVVTEVSPLKLVAPLPRLPSGARLVE